METKIIDKVFITEERKKVEIRIWFRYGCGFRAAFIINNRIIFDGQINDPELFRDKIVPQLESADKINNINEKLIDLHKLIGESFNEEKEV